jgi:hypothetical protein
MRGSNKMTVFQFDAGDNKIVEIDAPDAKTALDTFEQSRVSSGKAAVEGVLSGASLGFRDELSGAAAASDLPSWAPSLVRMIHGGALAGGEALAGKDGEALQRYRDTRDADRAAQAAAQEQHPYIYGGFQAAGSVLPGLATAGVVGPGASLVGTIGRGAVANAATGAVQGAGEAQTIGDIPREAGIGGAIGGVLGAAVPAVVGAARRVITPTANIPPLRQAAANTLRGEGVDLTPGQLSGSRNMRYFESEHGSRTAGGMAEQQTRDFTSAALRRAGIAADNSRPEVVDQAFTRIGGVFDNMARQSEIRVSRPLVQDLAQAEHDYNSLTPPSQRAPAVQNIITDIAHALNNTGRLSGEAYQSLRTRLNEFARRAGNHDLQEAFRGIQGALDNEVERNLPQHLQDAWATARRQYRNMLVIEKAATAAGPAAAEGVLTPQMLRAALVAQSRRSYARGTGDFNDLVRAGNMVMDKLPDSGTASRLKAQGVSTAILGGAGALLGGHLGDNTVGGATAGGVVGAVLPATAARIALSNLGRRWLANQRLPGQTGALTSALSAVPRATAIDQYKRRQQD